MMYTPHQEKEFILRFLTGLVASEASYLEKRPDYLRSLDWDWIIETASTQRILGFLTMTLKKENLLSCLSPGIQEALNDYQKKCLLNNRLKRQQFKMVSEILLKKGIAVAPLKGAALSNLIYEDMPFREMVDVDILVRESELEEAFELLVEAGFSRSDKYLTSNRWHDKIYAITSPSFGAVKIGRIPLTDKELDVDLHYTPRYLVEGSYLEMRWSDIWERALHFPQIGPNVYLLAPNDLLLHLVLHTVEFHSPRLRQVVDTALVIKRYDVCWEDARKGLSSDLPLPCKLSIDSYIKAIGELSSIDWDESRLSSETLQVFDRFFLRIIAHGNAQDSACEPENTIAGVQILKRIRYPWNKALFIIGYFVPNPDYYGQRRNSLFFLAHWRRMASKILRLIRRSDSDDKNASSLTDI